MTLITTNEGSIIFNSGTISSEPKGTLSCKVVGETIYIKALSGNTYSLSIEDTSLDGDTFENAQELLEALTSFKIGGDDGNGVILWSNITELPQFLAAGSTAALARQAIGAGTGNSNYSLPTGGTAGQYLNHQGQWSVPPDTNTTYAVITNTEFNTGTSNTARSVSAVSLNRDINAKLSTFLQGISGYSEGAILTVGVNGPEWVIPATEPEPEV